MFAQNHEQYADSIRVSNAIPELSYAVVSGDKILETNALGVHSVDLKDAATLNDRFHIGSNTKAMTAFVIAKYVEKGKLKWSTKFFDLFPDLKKTSKTDYYNITLEELVSHQARIQSFQGENDPAVPDFKGTHQEKRNQFGKFVLTLDPAKIDSEHKYIYSNAGYTLATMMLEKVTGKSWEQLIDQVFNKDLKLDVKLSWPENQIAKDTWGHLFENNKLIPVPSNTDYHLDYTEPAGDINIKLTDYIKFIQLNIRGLQGHDNYLKASTYHFIYKGIEGYSLGWFNSYEDNKDFSTHSGTAGTYYTIAAIDRRNFIGYIIFTNSFNESTVNGVRLLMRKLKKDYGS
ncbi:serine hydrolase domain-containing protein [Flavobacterium piscisymbiosum]|uniref:Beta-lactamase family protein n=1 Tax=Flavobacterium piscisymbiosum TaxID=2893753 RepID=A0ABS8MME8_9FLAO|nr:serine hydrolase domain-containing protein [Flavobacterium sp. F-30]MCC9066673.1 beta-lactamase family protein [Flavobacterium sp. F-30]